MVHSSQHMYDLVDALVLAGNSFRPRPPGMGSGPFWLTPGGPFCYLEAPIDFAVARAVPGQPVDLTLVEDNDLIACRQCWKTIQGPKYTDRGLVTTSDPTIKVLLSRDSVAMGDDADAPHEDVRDLPAKLSIRVAIIAVIDSGYLPRIAGGKASWLLTSAGDPIAVVAQQRKEPKLTIPGGSRLASLAASDGAVSLHFRYLAQQDPVTVYERLGTTPST